MAFPFSVLSPTRIPSLPLNLHNFRYTTHRPDVAYLATKGNSLSEENKSKTVSRYQFQIDRREGDFGQAMNLPNPPRGFETIQTKLIGWLGSQGWVLRLLNEMGKASLEKIKRELEN